MAEEEPTSATEAAAAGSTVTSAPACSSFTFIRLSTL